MNFLDLQNDVQGNCAFAPKISNSMQSVSLAANGSAAITVPAYTGKLVALFSYPGNGELWVAVNNAASAPAGAVFAATNSVANPKGLQVSGGDTINVLNNSATTQSVSVAFYAIS